MTLSALVNPPGLILSVQSNNFVQSMIQFLQSN